MHHEIYDTLSYLSCFDFFFHDQLVECIFKMTLGLFNLQGANNENIINIKQKRLKFRKNLFL